MSLRIKEHSADLLLLTVSMFWGTTFLITQDVIKSIPVFSFLFYRFFVATLLITPFCIRKIRESNKTQIINGCILGCILFLVFSTQTFGLVYTNSTVVAFLSGISVVIVPLLSWILFRHPVRKNVFIASLITVTGLYFFTFNEILTIGRGEIFGLLCAILFALHILFTDIFSRNTNLFMLVFFQILTVSILSMFFSFLFEETTFHVIISRDLIVALIITSVFATVYAFFIQTSMQKFTTPTKTGIILSMEPVFAALYSYITTSKVLTKTQLFGATLITLAAIVSEIPVKNFFSRKKEINNI